MIIEERADRLEEMMMKTQMVLQSLAVEMNIFKDEMRDFKEEIRKDTKQLKRDMNKRWGDLANKWGTIVEDMVAPSVESIGEKYFNLKECDTFLTSVKKRKPREKEFDVIAIYDTRVILVEVKSTPRTSYIEDFIEFIKNKEFYNFFPEYRSKELIPVFASLHIPDESIKYLSGNNILAMAMSDDIMDIVNPDVVQYLNKNQVN